MFWQSRCIRRGLRIRVYGGADTMKNRGRPSEQLKKVTCEGVVWDIVCKLRSHGDYSKTIRQIAKLSGYSPAAVQKTLAWHGYLEEKNPRVGSRRRLSSAASPRRRRSKIEARVFQIVKEAGTDYSMTVRQIAEIIGCSPSAVQNTEAWSGYVRAREAEKGAAALNLSMATTLSHRRGQRAPIK